MLPYTPAPSRRTHRKRISALRLSSDTTATLPEYSHWQHRHDLGTPSDLPPDYPDSAEEADEDTDDDQHTLVYTPQSSSRLASPRSRRYLSHRRKPSSSPPSTDSFLDSLLERSVHALEMSNALLQTSMAPQPSSSRIDDVDSRPSTSRLRNVRDVWADDLETISRDVDRLCEDGPDSRRNSGHSSRSEGSISMSLPISSSPPEMLQHHHRRRPSLEYPKANASTSDLPQLRLEPVGRARLVAPAPRAMTQYVASNGDVSTISLPSTLGLRSAPSAHCAPISPPLPPPSSTRAYNMLSSLVGQSSSSHSSTSSRRSSFLSRRSTSTSTERGGKSPDASRNKSLRSRSQTPKPIPIPTIEESPSSSSSEEWRAKMTVKSLRKILDEQPVPPPPPVVPLSHRFPISPASPPEASASTATASISRLFSKGTHSSSTRPPSPPRQSVLKTSPSTPSTSGRSTPRRISFAELPEAHQSQTGKFKDKGNKRKSKRKDKKEEHEGGWWGWLATGISANESRMEERMQRGWGGPSGRLDDWSV